MKNVGICLNCGRSVYINEINLCKRCAQEVGAEFLKKADIAEEEQEEFAASEESELSGIKKF